MEIERENKNLLSGKDYIERYLPFYFLLSQYRIGIISLGTIGLIIIVILTLIETRFVFINRSEFKKFYLFWLYAVLIDMIGFALSSNQSQINSMIEYSVSFSLIFISIQKGIEEEKLYKTWKLASIAYSAGLIYHYVMIYVMGSPVMPITLIPNYVLRDDFASLRPLSFFAEPESFVIAVLPVLFLALKKGDRKWAVGITIMNLLSTSTVGVVLSLVLWCVFVFDPKNMELKRRILFIVIMITIIIFFRGSSIFGASLDKFVSVLNGESTFESRLTNGFSIVMEMDWFSRIFGAFTHDPLNYINDNMNLFFSNNTLMRYWSAGKIFLNTFSQLIFKYGILGLILYLYPLISFMKNDEIRLKAFIIMFVIGIFGQTSLLNAYYFQTIAIIIGFSINVNNKNNHI